VKVTVDRDICARHGQSVHAAPEIFRLDDDGILTHPPGDLDESLFALAEEAADVCPLQAITLDEPPSPPPADKPSPPRRVVDCNRSPSRE
jgi:ferredoxin